MWWLQEGWTSARCGKCGDKIWPEGDPDWGLCYRCMSEDISRRSDEEQYYRQLEEEYYRQLEEERKKNE